MDKLSITKELIQAKIIDALPIEQNIAISLFMYGITENEFGEMELAISQPIKIKIQNYLRDEWRSIFPSK